MKTTFKLTAPLGALASVFAPPLHAQTSAWNGGGNDTYTGVIPEPTTWGLLAASLTTVMVLRRRRRS